MGSLKNLLVDVDFMAGVGAGAYAITSLFVPELAELVDSKIAFGAAVIAFGRWVGRKRAAAKANRRAEDEK